MVIIPRPELESNPARVAEVADVLKRGGLVCLPCGNRYRIVCDLLNDDAVTRLLQAKRRTAHKPSLVFVACAADLGDVADGVAPEIQELVDAFWPGLVTVLVRPNPELPRAVVKQLAKANRHLGVRVPGDPVVQEIVRMAGRPLLVSSANRQKKPGSESSSQVRQRFGNLIDVFVDAGEFAPTAPSTVVRLGRAGGFEVTRPGAISEETITERVAALRNSA